MAPKEIKKYKLLEVCDLIGGSRRKDDNGDYPVFGAGEKPTAMTTEYNCEGLTIRLTRKGTVGKVYLHEGRSFMEGDAYRVEPNEIIDKIYFFNWLKMNEEVLANCYDGTIMPGLQLSRLSDIEIEVPDMEYQLRAVEILNKIQDFHEFVIKSIPRSIDLLKDKLSYNMNSFIEMINEESRGLDEI